MQFDFKALLVLIGVLLLIALAVSSNGGGWFHLAEALMTVLILLGIGGGLTPSRSGQSR